MKIYHLATLCRTRFIVCMTVSLREVDHQMARRGRKSSICNGGRRPDEAVVPVSVVSESCSGANVMNLLWMFRKYLREKMTTPPRWLAEMISLVKVLNVCLCFWLPDDDFKHISKEKNIKTYITYFKYSRSIASNRDRNLFFVFCATKLWRPSDGLLFTYRGQCYTWSLFSAIWANFQRKNVVFLQAQC
jgi:hypothetical protein